MSYLHLIIFILLFLSLYSYIFYPFFLFLLSLFRKRTTIKAPYLPSVSFLISAHNEESGIRNKIINSLSLDYPEDLLQIIIVSDFSSDKTDHIIEEYPRIKLLRLPERRGKEYALKYSMKFISGSIIVFSDVGTTLKKNGLRLLVSNFVDQSVGVVSSTDKVIQNVGKVASEGLYVRYEMFLRKLESEVNGLIGVSGSLFAARKDLCTVWADDLASDFNIVLNAIRPGYRTIIDTDVIGYYHSVKNSRLEFPRKVRTVTAGITVFFRTLSLLNIFKYKLYSWQIFSHKLMRWMVPFFLISSMFVITFGYISGDYLSKILLFFQISFFITGVIGFSNFRFSNFFLVRIPFYFVEVNSAILVAWANYAAGKRITLWEPSKR